MRKTKAYLHRLSAILLTLLLIINSAGFLRAAEDETNWDEWEIDYAIEPYVKQWYYQLCYSYQIVAIKDQFTRDNPNMSEQQINYWLNYLYPNDGSYNIQDHEQDWNNLDDARKRNLYKAFEYVFKEYVTPIILDFIEEDLLNEQNQSSQSYKSSYIYDYDDNNFFRSISSSNAPYPVNYWLDCISEDTTALADWFYEQSYNKFNNPELGPLFEMQTLQEHKDSFNKYFNGYDNEAVRLQQNMTEYVLTTSLVGASESLFNFVMGELEQNIPWWQNKIEANYDRLMEFIENYGLTSDDEAPAGAYTQDENHNHNFDETIQPLLNQNKYMGFGAMPLSTFNNYVTAIGTFMNSYPLNYGMVTDYFQDRIREYVNNYGQCFYELTSYDGPIHGASFDITARSPYPFTTVYGGGTYRTYDYVPTQREWVNTTQHNVYGTAPLWIVAPYGPPSDPGMFASSGVVNQLSPNSSYVYYVAKVLKLYVYNDSNPPDIPIYDPDDYEPGVLIPHFIDNRPINDPGLPIKEPPDAPDGYFEDEPIIPPPIYIIIEFPDNFFEPVEPLVPTQCSCGSPCPCGGGDSCHGDCACGANCICGNGPSGPGTGNKPTTTINIGDDGNVTVVNEGENINIYIENNTYNSTEVDLIQTNNLLQAIIESLSSIFSELNIVNNKLDNMGACCSDENNNCCGGSGECGGGGNGCDDDCGGSGDGGGDYWFIDDGEGGDKKPWWSWLLDGLLDKAVDIIAAIISAVADIVGGLLDLGGTIVDGLSSVITSAIAAITDLLSPILDILQSIVDFILNFFENLFAALLEWLSNAFTLDSEAYLTNHVNDLKQQVYARMGIEDFDVMFDELINVGEGSFDSVYSEFSGDSISPGVSSRAPSAAPSYAPSSGGGDFAALSSLGSSFSSFQVDFGLVENAIIKFRPIINGFLDILLLLYVYKQVMILIRRVHPLSN